MFQTELNAWLQTFSTPWLDFIMRSVSFIGNGEITAAILIVLIFGFHFRLGITVLLAVLIGSAVTSTLKNVFEYPRPVFLSSDVGEPGDPSPPPTIYDDGGGSRFLSLPKSEAIKAMRAIHRERDEGADGLPSGHVTSAATLSIGIAVLFGGLRFLPLAVGWTLVMALSRMYLGRHFLADVLLGACIGILCVSFTIWVTRSFRERAEGQSVVGFAVIFIIASAFALLPMAELGNLGECVGLLIGIVVIIAMGVPADDAPIAKRVARVALGGAVYVAMNFIVKVLDVDETVGGELWESLVTFAGTCIATVFIAKRLALFEQNKMQNP